MFNWGMAGSLPIRRFANVGIDTFGSLVHSIRSERIYFETEIFITSFEMEILRSLF
jgi:hypothetical protein